MTHNVLVSLVRYCKNKMIETLKLVKKG